MSAATCVRPARLALAVALAAGIVASMSAAAGAMTVYSNLPKKLPGNVPSEGFEATSTSQLGNVVELSKSRRGRRNPRVTFTLSDWACQSGGEVTCLSANKSTYEWPITINLYGAAPGHALGALLATKTQTVTIPFRPSASPECSTKGLPGAWFEKKTGSCFHGFLFKDTYSFPGVTLPAEVVVGVSFNTENYGTEPTGVAGPENSLNVAMFGGVPRYGADPRGEELFVDSGWTQMYCGSSESLSTFAPSGTCPSYYEGNLPGLAIQTEK